MGSLQVKRVAPSYPNNQVVGKQHDRQAEGRKGFLIGRPAPEHLQSVGLPARASRGCHQKHIPMLEHGWRFPAHAREDLSVCAGHMDVVWCERTDVHDTVVFR